MGVRHAKLQFASRDQIIELSHRQASSLVAIENSESGIVRETARLAQMKGIRVCGRHRQ
jgi:hypothetical protein